MRSLEESDGEEDQIKEELGVDDDAPSDQSNKDPPSRSPSVTPLRELTPSTASNADEDPEYLPLSSIRSRGIGRTKTPRKAATPAKSAAKTTRARKQAKNGVVSTGSKKSKIPRMSAGERRMSQNRELPRVGR